MNIKEQEIRIAEKARWLIPGLQIKRWFLLYFVGAALVFIGFLIIFGFRPVYYMMKFVHHIANVVPTSWLAVSMVLFGLGLLCIAWSKTNISLLSARDDFEAQDLLESLYRRRKLNNGPKIVAIGGGTGLSMLLKGIKKYNK